MTRERIYEKVNNVFWEKKGLTVVSRANAGHQQISCAILEHKGDNNYPTEREGKSFGFRSILFTTPKSDVMMVVPEPLSDG